MPQSVWHRLQMRCSKHDYVGQFSVWLAHLGTLIPLWTRELLKQSSGTGWTKLHWLSERLAFLGIMGSEMKAPLKPLNTIGLGCPGVFKGTLNWDPIMPRDASLSDSCTSYRCIFFRLGSKQIPMMMNGLAELRSNVRTGNFCASFCVSHLQLHPTAFEFVHFFYRYTVENLGV